MLEKLIGPIEHELGDDIEGGHPRETVVRPVGIIHGPTAEAAVEADLATWLAGGPSAFTAVEVVEGVGTEFERSFRTIRQAGLIRAPGIAERVRMLTGKRQPLAGLSWTRPRILADLQLVSERGEAGERSTRAAVQHGQMLASKGADIVALSATGKQIDETGEVERIAPVVEELAARGIRVAVATRRPSVMRVAARAGARLIVDNAPGLDAEHLYTLGDVNLPIILRRQSALEESARRRKAVDLAASLHAALEERIEVFEGAGIPRERLIVDPGSRQSLPSEERLALLHSMSLFHGLGCVLFADCVGLGDAMRSVRGGGGPSDGTDAAFAALQQGVQVISVGEVSRAWGVTSCFSAVAAAKFDDADSSC